LAKLTPTSVIVLGLVELSEEATPYDLKRAAAASVGNFWSLPHSQLYAETERLAEAGLLKERRESGGRRRRVYSLTRRGRSALDAWRSEPAADLPELRDPALLKVFFGAEPAAVARPQLEKHRARLVDYERQKEHDDGKPPRGPWLALDAGIAHERVWVDYWASLTDS
jgi:DNA-binding PadR family transcriptional regulator